MTAFVDSRDTSIHLKRNRAITRAANRVGAEGIERVNVLLINNDVTIDPDFVTIMAAALRAEEATAISHPDDAGGTMTGWCFMLRGEDSFRADERFEWWYGDTDLIVQVEDADRTVVACPARAQHLHPNESTFHTAALLEAARRDEAKYAEKWGVDPATLFLARNPEWGLARGGIIKEPGAYRVGEAMAEITEDNLEEALLAVATERWVVTEIDYGLTLPGERSRSQWGVQWGGEQTHPVIAASLSGYYLEDAADIAEMICARMNRPGGPTPDDAMG